MNARFTDRTIEAAARWYARLQASDCTLAERAEFNRWCSEHPDNAAAYAAARDIAARLAPLARTNPRLKAMADAARAASSVQAPARRARRNFGVAAALAASVVALFGAATMLRPSTAPSAVETLSRVVTRDATRELALEDGSVVHLDVNTDIEIHFSGRERAIVLEHGRAVFDVAHDTGRPFYVLTGSGRVTAVGTRFQVERSAAAIVVTLAEGIVTVSDDSAAGERTERLVPGEELSIAPDDPVWMKRSVDARAATSWSLGRLMFREARLADALQQVNRYAAVKVRLGDSSLADLPVSGNFVVGDSRAVVAAFAAVLPLRIAADGDDLLLYRTQSEHR